MEREYNPNIRENDPIFLLRNIQELLLIAKENKNSSALLYACLDCRIALEILDFNIILHSVDPIERQKIIEDSKSKNGIDRINKKVGILKEKYQMFFQVFCEIVGIQAKSFDFKRSKDLQYNLSSYIHSYYMNNSDLNYDSEIMKGAINIINEVIEFIMLSLFIENGAYILVGINIEKIPLEDKLILDEWKNSKSMKYEELKIRLEENIQKRNNISI
jgi:hypothetical protein